MEFLSDERLQEYANIGVNVVGFKPQKKNREDRILDVFGAVLSVVAAAEVVSILAMVAGVM